MSGVNVCVKGEVMSLVLIVRYLLKNALRARLHLCMGFNLPTGD